MKRALDRRDQDEGFALAETLVAVAIIAAMMGLTFQTLSANAQAARLVAERREAVLIAQSVLAEATGPERDARRLDGRRGDLVWRVALAPYSAGARDGGPPLERVTVTVAEADGGGPLVTLDTLRLGR